MNCLQTTVHMKPDKAHRFFLDQLSLWEKALDAYSFEDLLKKPEDGGWSMGQLYIHLIGSTLHFQLKHFQHCMDESENSSAKKTFKGFLIFNLLGGFPPVRIKVPASEEYTPAQPESKEQLKRGLAKVRERMAAALETLKQRKGRGKSAHPALGYLSAEEWFALIPMHFKHHLRQKKRLDETLSKILLENG